MEGSPYVAKFSCHKDKSNKPEISGTIKRDSKGRFRVDYFNAEGNTILSVIDDVAAKTTFFLPASGEVDVETYGAVIREWGYRRVEPVETGAGDNIRDVACTRIRLKALGPLAGSDAGEVWIARQLGVVMKDINLTEGWTWEVTEIDFREPPLEAFHPKGAEGRQV